MREQLGLILLVQRGGGLIYVGGAGEVVEAMFMLRSIAWTWHVLAQSPACHSSIHKSPAAARLLVPDGQRETWWAWQSAQSDTQGFDDVFHVRAGVGLHSHRAPWQRT